MQKRRNSSALGMELRLFCINYIYRYKDKNVKGMHLDYEKLIIFHRIELIWLSIHNPHYSLSIQYKCATKMHIILKA